MGYMYPLSKGVYRRTQNFGTNPGGVNPAGGHTGQDDAVDVGTPVYAPADGVIVWADWCKTADGSDNPWLLTQGGGIVVGLDAGDTSPTFFFAHLNATHLNSGDRVRKGDIIGYSGNTGTWTTGPHLHTEAMLPGYWIWSSTYGRSNPDPLFDHFKEDTILKPNERMTGDSSVNQRKAPKLNAEIVRVIPARSKEVWEGYVHGEMVDMGGGNRSDIWLKDADGYASVLFFDPTTVDGLPDLTPKVENLAPNERKAGNYTVNQRKEPRLSAPVVREIPPLSRERWDGFVTGDEVVLTDGTRSNLWYKDSIGYASVLFFDPVSTDGLVDMTPAPAPTPDPAAPAPTPEPASPGWLNGVDISSHQAGIDVRPLGAGFVGIKATEGVGWRDPALAGNLATTRAAALPALFYHFARPATPENTPSAEAATFVEAVLTLLAPGDMLALDWEAENQHDTAWALEWLDTVHKATGRRPLIYMNASTANAHDWSKVKAAGYRLWLAAYPSSATTGFVQSANHPAVPGWDVAIWQYSSTGRLPGYGSNLDLNVFYGDLAAWHAMAAGETRPPAPEAPSGPPAAPDVPVTKDAEREALIRFVTKLVDDYLAGK